LNKNKEHRKMIIKDFEDYENIEIFPKLDEIEKIMKASRKKYGNSTVAVEQIFNDRKEENYEDKE
jgi:hypothetical protein